MTLLKLLKGTFGVVQLNIWTAILANKTRTTFGGSLKYNFYRCVSVQALRDGGVLPRDIGDWWSIMWTHCLLCVRGLIMQESRKPETDGCYSFATNPRLEPLGPTSENHSQLVFHEMTRADKSWNITNVNWCAARCWIWTSTAICTHTPSQTVR